LKATPLVNTMQTVSDANAGIEPRLSEEPPHLGLDVGLADAPCPARFASV